MDQVTDDLHQAVRILLRRSLAVTISAKDLNALSEILKFCFERMIIVDLCRADLLSLICEERYLALR